jgi:acyl dehydratase
MTRATPCKRAIFFPITRGRRQSLIDIHTRSLTKLPRKHPDDGYSQRGSKIILQGTLPSHGAGIQIGQFTELRRTFSQEDVNTFGSLIGDFNPVHYPPTHHSNDKSDRQNHHDTRQPILHGILLSSLFSTIFGTLIPGCIYRSQTLKFHQPVYMNEMICGRVLVTKLRKIDRGGAVGGVLCTCETTVRKDQIDDIGTNDKSDNHSLLCVTGEAKVWLPGVTLTQNNEED